MTIGVSDILSKVFGPKGIPFPGRGNTGDRPVIASGYKAELTGDQPVIASGFNVQETTTAERSRIGTAIRKYDSEDLGRYVFLPATLDGLELSNPVVIISGEKSITETDVVDVGTVFEKVFTRPYDISIICTLIGDDRSWPETQLKEMVALYKKDDVVTLKCALTDIFLEAKNNMIITNIAILDAQGAENVEVIQIEGRSNIDFELELI